MRYVDSTIYLFQEALDVVWKSVGPLLEDQTLQESSWTRRHGDLSEKDAWHRRRAGGVGGSFGTVPHPP